MKKTRYSKSKLSGKGFYIALAACLVVVGIATAIAINQTVSDLEEPTLETDSSTVSNATAEVGKTQSDVPMSSTAQKQTSSASAATSSSAASSTSKAAPSSAAQTAAPQAATEFALPLSGEVIKPYSNGELVKSETMGDWRTHDGIDIAADQGTPVKAAADGKVTNITNDPMWGVCITIDHGNNVESIYCGLNETVQVKMDQQVKLGDVIGSVGNTNQIEVAEAPHLHFGMKQDGKWVDPMRMTSNNE